MGTELLAAQRCLNLVDHWLSCEALCAQVAVFSILSASLADRRALAAGWLWLVVWWTGSSWFGFLWLLSEWVATDAPPLVWLCWRLLALQWLGTVCQVVVDNVNDELLLKIVLIVVTRNGRARRC